LGFVEGLSWLLLLFVAMPLKYGLDMPLAVRVVGSLHGGLFVLFVAALGWAHLRLRWSVRRSSLLFLSALLPFGFLFVDRVLDRTRAATQ
jgi:integral membrane protein